MDNDHYGSAAARLAQERKDQRAKDMSYSVQLADLQQQLSFADQKAARYAQSFMDLLRHHNELEVRYEWARGCAWMFGAVSVAFAALGLLDMLGVW